MDASDIKSRVSFLNPQELRVVKLLCEHPDYKDIDLSADTGWSETTCRNLRISASSNLRPFTIDQACPYILGRANDETDRSIRQLFGGGPPPPTAPTEIKDDPAGRQDEPRRRSPILLILGGLVGLIVLYWLLDALLPLTVTNEIEVTRIEEVTRIVKEEVEVTNEVTRIVESIEEVPVTVETTRLVEVVAEVPVTVEVTSAPTATPTPIAQSEYIEDFDDGEIDPAFTVSGNPIIVNGVLQDVTKESSLTIGDETWRNYRITFDYETIPFYSIVVNLRIGGGKSIECLEVAGRGECIFHGSGGNITIPDTYAEFAGKVDILVEDNQVSGSGERFFTFINNHSESGSIEIEFVNASIDNLVITRLD
jgi:hypothetical protein